MTALPRPSPALYTAAQCRELDRLAIARGVAGFDLMLRAGRSAFRELLQRWPEARRVAVCCGRGNNAGDGYIIAGLAREAGLEVTVHQIGDAGSLQGDAARARDWAGARGVSALPAAPTLLDAQVVVDALLGTGIEGPLREPFALCTAAINASGRPVLAVDMPTGVSADTGAATTGAVHADLTVTFIGRKLGLFTGAGVSHAGTVVFDDLGTDAGVYRAVGGCPWLHYDTLPAAFRLPARDANVYKHALGHLAVVGGDESMGGAPLMAAEAALRCGAGMVTLVTRAAHRPAVLARRPEIMVVDADDAAARQALLERASTVVVGPGLGRASWGRVLLEEALALDKPTVLDADGLFHFAAQPSRSSRTAGLIITPHVAEAARLLGSKPDAVQSDRPRAVRALAQRAGGVAVLKGAGTLLAAAPGAEDARGELLGLCAHGNPGMASAGMGDVLSGIIGGFLAQGLSAPAAAVAGTCLHGRAADRAAERLGPRSLLAMDLLPSMVEILAAEARAAS